MNKISENLCFGGRQQVWRHESRATGTPMNVAVFLPPQAESGPVPALVWLSGLTCTEENFTVKAGAQRVAAELGLALIAPDTSPRGADTPDDPAYDLGQGAGFYLDATAPPWAARYRMQSYVGEELIDLITEHFPIDRARLAISGHSMGGHGALVTALRRPGLFRSVSAFAPIASPMRCPWGRKAFSAYLGADETHWREWDATALLADGARIGDLLVDQGEADPFLAEQLRPDLLVEACAGAGVPLDLRRRPGYDHSYFTIATFIGEHLDWHAQRLAA
jgi:S-formylglutathione hydrolase